MKIRIIIGVIVLVIVIIVVFIPRIGHMLNDKYTKRPEGFQTKAVISIIQQKNYGKLADYIDPEMKSLVATVTAIPGSTYSAEQFYSDFAVERFHDVPSGDNEPVITDISTKSVDGIKYSIVGTTFSSAEGVKDVDFLLGYDSTSQPYFLAAKEDFHSLDGKFNEYCTKDQAVKQKLKQTIQSSQPKS